jgi:hypothetical protein
MQKIGGIWKPKYIFKILFEGGSGASWLMQKIGGIWKPKYIFKILFEGVELASWLIQKIGGIWKPKYIFKILFEGGEAGWCRKLAGSENPNFFLRFFLLMEGLADSK